MEFLEKLFESVIEIVSRRERINIYLFGVLVLNFSTKKFNRFIIDFRYSRHLKKLRFISKIRKIKIAFYVSEIEKWCGDLLYKTLEKNGGFEPVIYIAKQKSAINSEKFNSLIRYFKDKNYKLLYDAKKDKHLDIKHFKADIIFYQQPWSIPSCQSVLNASKFALVCYFPYCFHSLITNFNYFDGFHGLMWRYFVESDYHKKEYEDKFSAKNCTVSGSLKLDNYKNIKSEYHDKKTIIYAPHHSFGEGHNVATFLENGEFILQLAKNNPQFNWIIRPHPEFKNKLLKYMAEEKIENYFKQWSEIGKISRTDNYFALFISSDCLITDCISFLAEYLPSKKPVLHLRNKHQNEPFNEFLEKIIQNYYQINSNEELGHIFSQVILSDNDYMKEKRLEALNYVINENTASENILDYLEKRIFNGL